jgi:hypothetical protein
MEIRLNGKNDSGRGMKDFSAWISSPRNKEVLVLNLGECKITVHPFGKDQIRILGKKLMELSNC